LKRSFFLIFLILPGLAVFAQESKSEREISLPTSKTLSTPSPGRVGSTNSFPVTIAVSPDGKYAALLNFGYGTQTAMARQSIAVLNLSTNQLTDFPEERLAESAHQSYFLGLAFGSDGKHLYASVGSVTDPTGEKPGDTGNGIAVYSFDQGKVAPESFLKIAPQKLGDGRKTAYGLRKVVAGSAIPYPAGLTVVRRDGKDLLLVANNLSDNVVLLDTANGRVIKAFDVSTHAIVPSSFPYTVVASKDGHRAWCSLWNRSRVAELDLDQGKVTRWISLLEPKDPVAPGSHPTALLLSPDEKALYVALSNVDRVAQVSTESGAIESLLDTTAPGQAYGGSYPSALAVSSDGQKVFVADASLDTVAVFNRASKTEQGPEFKVMQAAGFIPTDWYPSALAVVGDDLLIATAKGQSTGPNNGTSQLKNEKRHREHPYIPTLLYGSLARLNIHSAEKQLSEMTRKVEESNLLLSDPGKIRFQAGGNPIKHVIYILKENRTYDQIFGDLKVGNGDSSLTMYGADITPNEHKLALRFGVLDNFYDSGEVSGDGHEWSNAAITSDYNEKTWQINYRGKERTYDFQGTVADEFPLENGEPDVDAPETGYIWDNLAKHGLTYRDYGEFVLAVWCKPTADAEDLPSQGTTSKTIDECPRKEIKKGDPMASNVGDPHGSASPFPWSIPALRRMRPTKANLRGHYDPLFPDFNTDYPDQWRADEFLNEFAVFVQARKESKGAELPQFVLLYLPDDHTGGTRAGHPTPSASVADNDLALGRVVDAVSHSLYWDDTAIFVIEDDAQDGADHVDAHRSIALAISKYAPGSAGKPFVDSRFYTTVNMMHTMETLLGLPPMNQNDGHAPVMAPLFSGPGSQPPYDVDASNRENGLIYKINPPKGQGAKESEKMDFSRPDAVNTQVLNAILWRDRKGNVPMPAPKHTVVPGKAGD
jgi:DNA-binding beta-propeller fold protein YncE